MSNSLYVLLLIAAVASSYGSIQYAISILSLIVAILGKCFLDQMQQAKEQAKKIKG